MRPRTPGLEMALATVNPAPQAATARWTTA